MGVRGVTDSFIDASNGGIQSLPERLVFAQDCSSAVFHDDLDAIDVQRQRRLLFVHLRFSELCLEHGGNDVETPLLRLTLVLRLDGVSEPSLGFLQILWFALEL